ncbi:MAG: CrcB family protein [Pseudomonadales bacterium]|nr:CrcB family protein [Pseudomonadales bacterium]
MTEFLAIALGGAVGALLRWGIMLGMTNVLRESFSFGTLLVNVVGSLLIGIAFVCLVERIQTEGIAASPAFKSAVMIGVLGAFTTFSTFSLQTLEMLIDGRWMAGSLYVITSVVLCLLATALGIGLARLLP